MERFHINSNEIFVFYCVDLHTLVPCAVMRDRTHIHTHTS